MSIVVERFATKNKGRLESIVRLFFFEKSQHERTVSALVEYLQQSIETQLSHTLVAEARDALCKLRYGSLEDANDFIFPFMDRLQVYAAVSDSIPSDAEAIAILRAALPPTLLPLFDERC
ncbi:MAG: hypothetical protein MHM6MM_007590 [Cercozoa sp. M6MM]